MTANAVELDFEVIIMKLQAMNKKITNYGYDYEIEYGNPDFHGHVKGVELCVVDPKTGFVTENHLPNSIKENRDEVLNEILNDDSIIKVINQALTAPEDGSLTPEDIYMLPYIKPIDVKKYFEDEEILSYDEAVR